MSARKESNQSRTDTANLEVMLTEREATIVDLQEKLKEMANLSQVRHVRSKPFELFPSPLNDDAGQPAIAR